MANLIARTSARRIKQPVSGQLPIGLFFQLVDGGLVLTDEGSADASMVLDGDTHYVDDAASGRRRLTCVSSQIIGY